MNIHFVHSISFIICGALNFYFSLWMPLFACCCSSFPSSSSYVFSLLASLVCLRACSILIWFPSQMKTFDSTNNGMEWKDTEHFLLFCSEHSFDEYEIFMSRRSAHFIRFHFLCMRVALYCIVHCSILYYASEWWTRCWASMYNVKKIPLLSLNFLMGHHPVS